MKLHCFLFAAATLLASSASGSESELTEDALGVWTAIDTVWAGHYVGFDVLVEDGRIYVGYYDANRQLTIASRPRSGSRWVYHKLQSWLGWDSHNGIALAVDGDGHLHLAANMH